MDLLVVYDGEKREDATKSLISCSRKASISVCQKPKVFEHGENGTFSERFICYDV